MRGGSRRRRITTTYVITVFPGCLSPLLETQQLSSPFGHDVNICIRLHYIIVVIIVMPQILSARLPCFSNNLATAQLNSTQHRYITLY